jgi:hypothetical protein
MAFWTSQINLLGLNKPIGHISPPDKILLSRKRSEKIHSSKQPSLVEDLILYN